MFINHGFIEIKILHAKYSIILTKSLENPSLFLIFHNLCQNNIINYVFYIKHNQKVNI